MYFAFVNFLSLTGTWVTSFPKETLKYSRQKGKTIIISLYNTNMFCPAQNLLLSGLTVFLMFFEFYILKHKRLNSGLIIQDFQFGLYINLLN